MTRAGDSGWAVPGAGGFAGKAGGGFLGDNVLVITGTGGEREVIPGLRPGSHAAHPSDGSSSPSHPGAVSDSFPFSSPLALTSFRGLPWRAEPAQPLPSLHLTPHHASVGLLSRVLGPNHPLHHPSGCSALHLCSLEGHDLSPLTAHRPQTLPFFRLAWAREHGDASFHKNQKKKKKIINSLLGFEWQSIHLPMDAWNGQHFPGSGVCG